ncbi:hypothetical protein OIDMADRAFT_188209 [Oidiodendron maius Zn]|uniref:FAD/NAD(P)-binding domain-containing protein n=1 Tax=Oidiodendron maius (strain Zn) TaxID=913774 RepID=A0A0C3E2T2_OIDMZ|nr:hypothetical protein OIDMADRAFT_188209 [Oidiodendron maius Zn]
MASDKLKIIGKAILILIPYGLERLRQKLLAVQHRWSYEALPTAQNVVIIGGSFAGIELAKRLVETLPTGYRVILIEKNSHLNFSWVFPRFSVISGYEKKAFIPYDGIARSAPAGIFSRVQDTVTDITASQVNLASGEKIDYAYLAIATGSSQPLPAKVLSTDANEGSKELRTVQEHIQAANRVAVIGGGAMGIEIATDIKSFFPSTEVTVFHSRNQLLPSFGQKLHDFVLLAMETLGIKVVLEARPEILPGQKSLRLAGVVQEFDFIIPCTGQHPNSSILESLESGVISKMTKQILVKPTLQLQDPNGTLGHIFAVGDVANTGGPKMGRAGLFQSEVVVKNILAMIDQREPAATYKPKLFVEGAIKLTLGKTECVMYAQEEDGTEYLFNVHNGREDLGVERAWWQMGTKYKADT